MTLLMRPNCIHCDEILKRFGAQIPRIFKVVAHPDGALYVEMDTHVYYPLPDSIVGLPALIDETGVYMGTQPILRFMEGMNARTV